MKLLGFLICFALMLWMMDTSAGISAFIDTMSVTVVLGGGIAYAVAKAGISQTRDQALLNFADGAVYWGWLGFLVGCVAIAGTLKELSGLGPAAAIAFLTILYGYFIKWMIMALVDTSDTKAFKRKELSD